jgi:hypothetical protein
MVGQDELNSLPAALDLIHFDWVHYSYYNESATMNTWLHLRE